MLRLLLLATISLTIICVHGRHKEDLRKVHLKGLGNVLGAKFWDGEFYEFFGIPYATAPKDRDRFKAPLPPTPWKKDMKANRGILMCQQVYYSESEEDDLLYGEEECLVVSLMVPKIASKTNLVPVIVYVHSGAYAGGNGNMAKYHFIARQDIIVVNFNYRLGALGFACLGTEDIPGNAALKDIIAALKFIKEHVKSFGGDPDNITLAGYSIGASLAEIVALSKESRGLFNKLYLDSGSALAPFAINRHPLETARNIAAGIGFKDTGNIADLNEFYLEADLEDMQSFSRQFYLKNSTFGFTPCIENPANPGAVVTESPLETLKKGNYGDFALVTGLADMEGISRTSQFDAWRGQMNEKFADFLPADLVFDNEKERDEFIKELKQFYFNSKPLTVDSLQGYIDYFSDSMFKYSIMKSVKLHAENLKKPIYLYEFTYVGKLNTKHAYMDRIRGASHRDASAYVLDFYDWTSNYTDMDMRDLMTSVVADFVKVGNPTPYESALLTTKWLKYTNKDPNYLDMGEKFVMKRDLFKKQYELWDKVYKKHYWSPTAVDPNSFKPKPRSITKPTEETKPQEIKSAPPPVPKPVEEPAAKKPAEVNNKPVEADKKPTETSKKPVEAVKKATEADKKSTEASKKPAEVDKKPTEASKKPAEADKKPTETSKKPAAADKKQATPNETPSANPKSSTDSKAKDSLPKSSKQKPVQKNIKIEKPAAANVKDGKEDVKK